MKKLWDWFGGSKHDADFALPVDLTSKAFFEDPSEQYAHLRKHHPIAPVTGGGYVLTRHADIQAALSNPLLGNAPSRFSVLSARNKDKHTVANVSANILPFLDKPEHVAARQISSSAFHDVLRDAQDWLPALARAQMLRQESEEVDLISAIARPFICGAMARFIGVDMSAQQMKAASQSFFRLFAPMTDVDEFERTNTGLDVARAAIEQSQVKGDPPNLLGLLLASDMPKQMAFDTAYLMLADGIENIEAAIAMVFQRLQLERFKATSEQDLDAAITECLRLSSPAQILPRVAREALVLKGVEIAAGMPVFLALGSANLDPEVYSNPETFNLGRETAPLLVFGRGRHSCIGALLAQLLIKLCVVELLNNKVTLATGRTQDWHARFGHRWPKFLSVKVPDIPRD